MGSRLSSNADDEIAVPNSLFDAAQSEGLLRTISAVRERSVVNTIGKKVSPEISTIFILNSMTGVAVLSLPYAFAQAGIALSTAVVGACLLVAFMTATFMTEVLSIANAIFYETAELQTINSDPALRSRLHDEHEVAKSKHNLKSRQSTLEDILTGVRANNARSEFKIRERVELGFVGETVLVGKAAAALIYIVILAFTYGSTACLTVTVNQSLAHTLLSVMAVFQFFPDADLIYRLCIVVVFCVALPLCFSDLQRIKRFLVAFMTLRFLAITGMVSVGFYVAICRIQREGLAHVFSTLPMWRPEGFAAVFGNSVFMFGIHHYLPGMLSPLEPMEKANRVVLTAFVVLMMLVCTISMSALIAWGDQTHETCSVKLGGHFCRIQPLYNLNFQPLDWFGGTLALFILAYAALGIASLPAAAITIRSHLERVLGVAPPDPEKPVSKQNVALTVLCVGPPFGVALVTQNVQVVIKYVGSYAGLMVGFVFPIALLVAGRQKLKLYHEKFNRPLRSAFGNRCIYFIILVFVFVAVALTTKQLFLG